jgi:hypothetical protein
MARRSVPSAPRSRLADLDDELLDAVGLATLEPNVGAEDGAHIVGQPFRVVDVPSVAGDALDEAVIVTGHISHHDAHTPAPRPPEDAIIHKGIVGRRPPEGQNRTAPTSSRRGHTHPHDRQMVRIYLGLPTAMSYQR